MYNRRQVASQNAGAFRRNFGPASEKYGVAQTQKLVQGLRSRGLGGAKFQ